MIASIALIGYSESYTIAIDVSNTNELDIYIFYINILK